MGKRGITRDDYGDWLMEVSGFLEDMANLIEEEANDYIFNENHGQVIYTRAEFTQAKKQYLLSLSEDIKNFANLNE